MTEFEKLLAEGPKATEFKDYSDWVKERPTQEDQTQSKLGYADYLRKTHIDSGEYSPEVESSIQNELYGNLVTDGVVEEGDFDSFQKLQQPEGTSLEAKMDMIQSRISKDSAEWEYITNYKEALQQPDKFSEEEMNQMRSRATESTRREYDAVKKQMVRNGELAFASVIGDSGEREVIAGDAALTGNLSDNLAASKMGDVSFSDALQAQQQLTPFFGTKTPLFKMSRYNQALAMTNEILKSDKEINDLIQGHAKLRSDEEDEGFMDTAADVVNAFGDSIMGLFSEDKRRQNTAMFRAKTTTREQAVAKIMNRINSSDQLEVGEEFTAEEINSAFDHMVLNTATQMNMFDQYTGEDAGRNLRVSAMGVPIMSSAVLANEDLFNETIGNSDFLTSDQKQYLKDSRVATLTEKFDQYSEIFKRSGVDDEWNEALIDGANKGLKNHEILNEFLKDEDNYSMVTERAKGIAWSLVDSVGTLIAAIPAASGNKLATDYLADMAQRNADRREVARLFGQEYGYMGEIGETIVPMVTDMAATTVLSSGTFGTAGAAYVAARSGSAAVAKTVTKSYVKHIAETSKSVFRSQGKKYTGKLSDAVVQAVKTGHKDLTFDVLKTFNSEVARKTGIASAAAIPAAVRSSAATYGSITNTLRAETEMSDEEIRDKAMGAAMASGAITGIITGGFSALGRGGFDDALIRGMTFRDMTTVIGKMTNVTNKAKLPQYVKEALGKSIAETAKKAGLASAAIGKRSSRMLSRAGEVARNVGRNFGDEAVEEGLDEFFQSFVEDAALDQDTPMFDRLSQAGHAAIIGGIMGSTVPAVQAVGRSISRRKTLGLNQPQIDQMVSDVAQRASANLSETGSPITAAVFEKLYRTPLMQLAASPKAKQEAAVVEEEQAPEVVEAAPEVVEATEAAPEVTPDDVEAAPEIVEEVESAPEVVEAEAEVIESEETEADEEDRKQVEAALREVDPQEIKDLSDEQTLNKDEADIRPVDDEYIDDVDVDEDLEDISMAEQTDLQAELEEELEVPQAPAKKAVTKKAAVAKKAVTKKAAVAKKAVTKKAAVAKKAAKKVTKEEIVVEKKAKRKKARIQKRKSDPFYLTPVAGSSKDFYNNPAFLSKDVDAADVTDEDGKIVLSTKERELADKMFELVGRGFPVSIYNKQKYGLDISKHSGPALSTALAKEIYDRYPVFVPSEKAQASLKPWSAQKEVTHYDPKTGQRKSTYVKGGFVTEDGVGVFDNNPVMMLEMLARSIPVFIPKEFRNSPLLNPAFRGGFDKQNGELRAIVGPHKDFPSQPVRMNKVIKHTDLPFNYDHSRKMSTIPFKFWGADDKFIMPKGVSLTDPMTGKPLEASHKNQHKISDVHENVDRFSKLLQPKALDSRGQNFAWNAVRNLVSPFKLRSYDRLRDDADFSIASVATDSQKEYNTLLNFYKIRQDIITNDQKVQKGKITLNPKQLGRAVSSFVKRIDFEESVGSSNKERIEAVSDMLKDYGLKEYDSKTPQLNVKNFVQNVIINNQSFVKTGQMPDFMTLVRQNVDRYIGQSVRRDSANIASKAMSYEELVEIRSETGSFGALEAEYASVDPDILNIDSEAISGYLRSAVDEAIAEVNDNPEVKKQLQDLYVDVVLNNSNQEAINDVPNLPSEFLISSVADIIKRAGYENDFALDAMTIKKEIEQSILPSASKLKTLLELAYYPDAKVLEAGELLSAADIGDTTKAYAEFRRRELARLNAEPKPEPSLKEFVETREQASKPVLTEYAKKLLGRINNDAVQNSASQALNPMERAAMREDNKAEIERLGLENNDPESVVSALKIISAESDNPSHKLVADLLLEDPSFIRAVSFHIIDSPSNFAGQYLYRADGTHSVSINMDTGNKLGLENVLLEEYVHAFLSNVTRSSSDQRTPAQNAAVTRLNGIYKLAEKQYLATGIKDPMLDDAFVDFDEFLAKFLLSPKLQASIKSLQPPAKQRGFFRRIIDSLVSMFRKVSKTEAVDYAAALKDVIDLTKSSITAQPRPLSQEAAQVGKEMDVTVKTAQEKVIERQEQLEDTPAPVEVEADEAPIDQARTNQIEEVFIHIKSRTPAGLTLQDAEGDFTAQFSSENPTVIQVNKRQLELETKGMDMLGAKMYAEKTVLHEVIHVAAFNSLTPAEVQELADSLTDGEYEALANRYYTTEENRQASLARLADPELEAQERFILTQEKLRMDSEKILTGTTTEEDAEFWATDPSLLRIFARYVRGLFSKLAAIRRAERGSGVLDEMLMRIHDEVTLIQSGYVSYDIKQSFDTDNPEDSLRQFNQILQRDTGVEEPQDVSLQAQGSAAVAGTASGVDFSRIPALLEMPMAEFKTYKSPTSWFARNIKGDVDLPIKKLMEQRAEFQRASTHVVKSFHKKFDTIVKRDFGEMNEEMRDLVNLAQGYRPDDVIGEGTYQKLENEHLGNVRRFKKERNDTINQLKLDESLSDAERKKGIKDAETKFKEDSLASRNAKRAKLDAAEQVGIDKHQADVNEAIEQLRLTSPDLAGLILSMREQLIQPLQKILTATMPDSSSDLKAKIDRSGGIYITRQYKIFNDPTYAEKVLEDPQFESYRQAAINYFSRQGLSDAEAREAMRHFVRQYDSGPKELSSPASKSYRKLVKNLSKRKEIPQELRQLMGEYGLTDAKTGDAATNLLIRTFATVSALTAQQKFRSNIAEWGGKSNSLVTLEEKNADPEKYGDYVLLLDSSIKGDPLAGLYAPADMKADLQDVLKPSLAGMDTSSAAKSVEGMAKVIQNLTGKSMVFKTIGSVGFFLRNIFGNVLFFGPAQGISLDTMGANFRDSFSKSVLQSKDEIDAELTEMVALGVFGDELRAGLTRELLDGKKESYFDKVNNILDKLPDDKAEGAKKVYTKGKEKIKKVEDFLLNLSSNIDGIYKINYYKNELAVLQEAVAKHPESDLARDAKENPDILKRMAAEKVKMTAQSLSQAPPLVTALSRSAYGQLFAPFIRFKTEVPRIVFNTFKLAKQEIDSGNPVLVARGRRRKYSMMTALGAFSLGLPAAVSYLLGGVGDDEDEALRKSMPSYLRGHSFFVYRWFGELKSIDMTYVNPFSLIADPFARAFQEIMRGDLDGAIGAFLSGAFFDQYLDDQILAGAIIDAKNNLDAKTDRPISISAVDGFAVSFGKRMGYVLKQAFAPRIATDFMDAVSAVGADGDGDFGDTPTGEFLDGMYPFRIHSIDVEKQMRRYIYEHKENVNQVRSAKYRMYSDKPMSEGEIRDIYNDEADGLLKLNKEAYTVLEGFQGLGMSKAQQFGIMKRAGIGKDKARLLRFGLSERLTPNLAFTQGLRERGLSERIKPLIEERNKRTRYDNLKD